MAGITAFREAYLSGGHDLDDFQDHDARQLRYSLYWAFYENTAYRNIHSWAVTYRQQQGLYKYVRGVYNPTYRLGEFWKAHLWGGRLDLAAGDGRVIPTALPIETKNEALRPALGQLWRWSNWQINKSIPPLYGSILGDVALQVVDDVERKKVYLQVIHPAALQDITVDAWGNVKAYVIQETRPHPVTPDTTVTYKEVASRDGQDVVYQTYLNDTLYAWGETAEWREPYGFIPLVMIQHNNVGMEWGWSEIHAGRPKFQETDDLASKLSDQIRKSVDAPWLFSGIEKPRSQAGVSGRTPSTDIPVPGREEIPALWGPAGAHAEALIAPLDIGATTAYIQSLLAELERDYPELQMDIWTARGDASGRALRVARQRVETKVQERRAIYDDALVRAQQMAVAIGGMRGYQNFSGFGAESYAQGKLEHAIGERPVFAKDPLDDIEVEGAFWTAAGAAIKAGVPILLYLKRQGWNTEEINELSATPEYQAHLKNMQMAALMAEGLNADNDEGEEPEQPSKSMKLAGKANDSETEPV